MPASPATRYSPGREPRADKHKRGRSLDNGIVFKERDDDLALFNEVQNRESDNFLLQSNDDFEDTFVTKLRHFSDHKLGINIAARGESSDFLNAEEEKNDYEWLITPPDTPLFPSLDDETPQVILAQRGRPQAQPISISRSSTMEKSHRSSRGSASPNRLSPSPRSREPTFQPRGRASSAPSRSPPPTLRPATRSKRPSSPSNKHSTPNSRRLSTGSVSTIRTGARGISPVKTSRGNSASPKVKAWQANIPGFSTEAPPNLRTSLADRPASYVRGSSPASRNGRQSMSPTASRSISSSHSHDRDRFSSYSKGSVASSADDDDVESLPSITVDASQRSISRKVSGFRNNKAPFSPKPNRTVSSSTSAPKRSFDLALRQMDHRKGPQNMFRPLLSSVPTSNFYAGKASPAWNSSVTTSSNASSDLCTSGPHDIQENDDDATSQLVRVPDSDVDDEVFMFEKTDCLNENIEIETHDINISPSVQLGNFKADSENHVVSDDFLEVDSLTDILICSRCGCRYSVITQTEDDIGLCENCQKSNTSLTITDMVTDIEATMSDKDNESTNTVKPQMTEITKMALVEVESSLVTSKVESQSEPHEDLVKDGESESTHAEVCEPMQVNHQVVSQPSEQIDFPNIKVDSLQRECISLVMKSSSSIKGRIDFSASSISYDDLSYVRGSTNSMRSSVGRGSVSASSSVDFGPAMQTDTRFQRQFSSRKSDTENYKNDPNLKHRRSVSSLSGNSSHAFHPSSVGTSTLDSFDVSIANVGPQENPSENEDTSALKTCTVEDTSALATCTVEDTSALVTCTVEEDTGLNPCVENTDVAAEVQLGVISEIELDHTCLSSPASESDVSQCSEKSMEEFQDPPVSVATDRDTLNHSSSIIEESMVLVEGQGGMKGKSLTLEEATDTILFCSSIVHNLAYEAATIAIEKETLPEPSENNDSFPLVPAVGKGRKDVQSRKTSKRSFKSQKTRQRKTMEKDTTKAPNNINTNAIEEADLPKTHIVYPNNEENTKPPKLESKCNCRIM